VERPEVAVGAHQHQHVAAGHVGHHVAAGLVELAEVACVLPLAAEIADRSRSQTAGSWYHEAGSVHTAAAGGSAVTAADGSGARGGPGHPP